MIEAEITVIGAGIAGASLAALLSKSRSVILLDMKAHAGYHSTGRSAALFTENYGAPAIRALTRVSRSFFENTPTGFSENLLLSPRGFIHLARADQLEKLKEFGGSSQGVRELSASQLQSRIPYLNTKNIVAGMLEEDGSDIDVNALHTAI